MKSTKKPKFLLVRYAPGSAGMFLISLLMGSKDVAHFDPVINQNKTINNCILYIKDHFTPQISDWLKREPRNTVAWNLHFVSAKYSRGHDMSYAQFIDTAQQEATTYFWEQVNSEKIIVTPWHKPYVPDFYKDAKIVTIIIDKKSEKWFHRALWSKLYGIDNGKIHLKMNDPVFNPPMQQYFAKFNNPTHVDEHFYSFVKREIFKDRYKEEYMDASNFSNDSNNQAFINLSDLLDTNSCVFNVARVCQELDIASVPDDLVRYGQIHWNGCHNFKYAEK